jgi:hypothetical protein
MRARKTDMIPFVHDGRTVRVDLGAPMQVSRDGTRMVGLIDLWVSTMLPGDIFDMRFTLLAAASGSSGAASEVVSVDGLSFARGFLAVGTRELFWPDRENAGVVGARVDAIVTSGCVARARAPRARAPRAPRTRGIDLRRILPMLSTPYPPIAWRVAG